MTPAKTEAMTMLKLTEQFSGTGKEVSGSDKIVDEVSSGLLNFI
jgi:hypothetical protein